MGLFIPNFLTFFLRGDWTLCDLLIIRWLVLLIDCKSVYKNVEINDFTILLLSYDKLLCIN